MSDTAIKDQEQEQARAIAGPCYWKGNCLDRDPEYQCPACSVHGRAIAAFAKQRERLEAAQAAAVHLYICTGCGTCETLYNAATRRGDA